MVENHASWIYIGNIIFDTFKGESHLAYTADTNATTSFNNNIYFNSYGTPLLFGPNQTFVEWQKSGSHSASAITDPLFMNDVNRII